MKIIYALLLGIVLSTSLYAEETTVASTVINLAGKQRMLTQKMSKEALLIIKGIEEEKNKKSLEQTIVLFDKTLHGLRDGDADLKLPKTKEETIVLEIDKGIKLWHLFQKFLDQVVEGKANKETLKAIEIANMPLLKVMSNIVHLYEKKYGSDLSPNLAKTINLAGRERMLIQKMTKELLLIANNMESDTYIKSLQTGGTLFQSKLSELMQDLSHIEDKKLAQRVEKIQSLWGEYQKIIANTELSTSGVKAFNQKEKEIVEKMTNELVSVAELIDEKRYQINLGETEKQFDSTLTALIHGDKRLGIIATDNSDIQKQLKKVETLWDEYRPIILKVDTSEKGLLKAMEINMPLLQAMDRAVMLYEQR